MIYLIEFDTWQKPWKDLSQQNYERLRGALPELPEAKPDWLSQLFHVDLTEIYPLLDEFHIVVNLHPSGRNGMLVTLKDRIAILERDAKLTRHQLGIEGAIVQIHVPNIGLIAMNEVRVLEDACTDALQKALDEGWSILAVCPPNAQRRPDYILGRSNPGRRV